MATKFGIDISRWQGNFNIANAIKNNKVQFAILKIGGGDNVCYKDSKFEDYYKQCEANNLPKGCYFFGHALDMATAKKEADYWIELMKGHKFEYPVFYDVEAQMLTKLGKRELTEIVKYVCDRIEKAGYWVGIYSSTSSFRSEMFDDELKKYSHWYAQWSSNKPTASDCQMWQFGGETNKIQSNKINGITVDQDYCYVDYPTLIKQKGLNGYSKSGTTVKKKTNAEIAQEVLDGKWGNAPERKVRLTEAGYNYSSIQTLVNKMVKEGK